ncbi:hypothetical protein C8N24_1297 [Solirubrobacter pauli]|jgi:hypothetical protein|uniref:Uncharacterized protein n=1 Tax=Solirubrobacter pauli TaxID=166793 RepID=A0A660LB83_9ACTN|nr:hypothetical protein C8N24_1297 [Solirubrobacter pauli]
MQRQPAAKKPAMKRPLLPPKRAPRPALKPIARQMPKQQHRGGR